MAIATRPSKEYRDKFEDVFGRKCFWCKKPLDENLPEYVSGEHEGCRVPEAESESESS